MATGSVTLNGLDDGDLVLLFEHKAKHEGVFTFNPQVMKSQQQPKVQGRPETKTVYDNVTLAWAKPDGLKAVIELLERFHHRRNPAAVAQA